jgi:radical SAM superfamily enzyme YgiQ (UPF0313 family)
MASVWSLQEKVRRLRAAEDGTLYKQAPTRVALVYPSPYKAGMSSLGYQTLYRILNERPGVAAERAFLPDDPDEYRRARLPLFTVESETPVSEFPIVALSVAYELELGGLLDCLALSGFPLLADERGDEFPLVVAGGPLTFSNPLPCAPFVDVIVLGEAEQLIHELLDLYEGYPDRRDLLAALHQRPGFYVPRLAEGAEPGPIGKAEHSLLPAYSQILTPHTELASMFLIEPERGCHRGCTFCVMRRSTNGGMRLVTPERVFSLIPERARRVGLVGAAVSDHPKIVDILEYIVASGREVSVSSLRADRLNERFVKALRAGGYRTLTVASDGASERLRKWMEKRIKEEHLQKAAALAKLAGMTRIKLYQMVGVPGETDEDIDEVIASSRALAKTIPVALGVACFVAKRMTPLDGAPYEETRSLDAKLRRIERGLKGAAEVRALSSKWGWVEYQLAQGNALAGLRYAEAKQKGGKLADFFRAFSDGEHLRKVAPPAAPPPRALPSLPLVNA